MVTPTMPPAGISAARSPVMRERRAARLTAPGGDLADHRLMDGTRRLIIMRHAKAGELPGGPDFERALKSRGRTDSAAAGQWLRASGYRPEVVLCSAARRARQTWQYVAETLGAEAEVLTEERLYGAGAGDLAAIVRETPAGTGTLMYVGHNPAAADLVAMLTGTEPHFPTAAIAIIGAIGDWADLAPAQHELQDTWTPARG
jgi:phosphohistidine phosphatase